MNSNVLNSTNSIPAHEFEIFPVFMYYNCLPSRHFFIFIHYLLTLILISQFENAWRTFYLALR